MRLPLSMFAAKVLLALQISATIFVLGVNTAAAQTRERELTLAAAFQLPQIPAQIPGLSSVTGAADWRQYDSFFTFVVKQFSQHVSGDLKDSLGDAFLDSRYDLTRAIAPGRGGNPVPDLFLSGWSRLSPIMNKALPGLPKQTASQYASFISAADKLAPLGRSASQLGLVQFSPDALRGMARLLEPSGRGDPLAFSTGVDSGVRSLLGFGSPLAVPVRRTSLSDELQLWGASEAIAAESGGKKLNDWIPDAQDLADYLKQVRGMLITLTDKISGKEKMTEEHKLLYRQIVFTAAWQESCWRQYIKKGKNVTPLASATGDVGLMQVNRNTWRGVYDLKGLNGDIEYNGSAGAEILDYYLVRHAIKRNEDKQPGGNLARATYSAYNGGPGALRRYRAAKPNPALKKVDQAFWEKFQAVSSGRELDVQRCYDGK